MSKMKDKHIDEMNKIKDKYPYKDNMSLDEVQELMHHNYIAMVNNSGIPLWMYEQYYTDTMCKHKDKEEGSQNLENSGPQELPDECYDQQEEDIDYLCRLNGYED